MGNVTKSCDKCGAQLPSDAAFCMSCGTKQPKPVARTENEPRRGWIRRVPGFRSGRRSKQVTAIVGYLIVARMIQIGISEGSITGILLGLELIACGLLVANVGGVREHTPLVRSRSRFRAATGWTVLVFAGLMLVSAAASVEPPTQKSSGAPTPARILEASARQVPISDTVASPTSTSEPTKSPAPTATRVPPTATPPPSPAQRIETAARKVLGDDFRSVEMLSPVYPAVSTNLAEIFGNIEWSAGYTSNRFVELAPQVFAIPEVEVFTFNVYATLVDVYGKERDARIAYLTITRDTAAKVNWSSFDSRNVNRLLKGDGDAVALTNLEFRKAWNSIQNK